MSYTAPGPEDPFFRMRRKKEDNLVAQARQAADELAAKQDVPDTATVSSYPARSEEHVAAAGPPVLDRLREHEDARTAARTAGDTELADRALRQVVGDLDELLDTAADHLRQSGKGLSRQRVRTAAPQLLAMSGVAALPLGEVAGFLDLPREQVEDVLAALRRHGGITPADRHQALQQVEWLRGQLRQVELTRDQSLLDRLLAFVSKFTVLVVVAVASAAAGAVAAGESVLKEIIKAGVVMLVAAALQGAADRVREGRPGTDAREAHAALLADLPQAHALWERPSYQGEHTVLRIRLGIRCCAARIATISLEWQDKQAYWALLDATVEALRADSPAELAPLPSRLSALRPPA
ncbi:hypothetical protein [Amycolatopsis sp. GM8]|uniref:hypothetical protein n=1 Tax=Amycolatopsis sp. GM8 TaxID=2896530 RepID=UPI001F25D8BB|nr:hypothetical protein [Amycolatopsis sp. GM8]